jgi:hypothetical protein
VPACARPPRRSRARAAAQRPRRPLLSPASTPAPAADWRFQGIVKGLPWRPLLAAAGSTTHVIDPETGLVVEHMERWKANPGEVRAGVGEGAREETVVGGWGWGVDRAAGRKRGGDEGEGTT